MTIILHKHSFPTVAIGASSVVIALAIALASLWLIAAGTGSKPGTAQVNFASSGTSR